MSAWPIPLAAGAPEAFGVALLVLGGLLMFGALISGIVHRSFLSLTVVFVVAGFVLGRGGLDVLHFAPRGPFVAELATLALVVILFRDGLEVEKEMLQRAWHLPARKLLLAMPLTAGLVALATRALTGLGWTESFLLGALLAPTDPVLSSSVVTDPRVPRIVRHSLNLESGMNDGLALPAVVALIAALRVGGGDFVWWEFVLQDLGVGLVTGALAGFAGARLLPRGAGLDGDMPAHQKSLYALGVAFAAYGVAVLPPRGNGLIAVFVSAIVLGILRPDLRSYFEERAQDLVEIVKLGIFVVFGSLLTFDGLLGDGWAAVGLVAFTLLVARPVAVSVALAGTRTDAGTRAFMAWFGPKGVATMTFSLIVLSEPLGAGPEIFNLAALVVFCSIVAHGLTDTPGARWLARRSAGAAQGATA